jgi:hypothetical protein
MHAVGAREVADAVLEVLDSAANDTKMQRNA